LPTRRGSRCKARGGSPIILTLPLGLPGVQRLSGLEADRSANLSAAKITRGGAGRLGEKAGSCGRRGRNKFEEKRYARNGRRFALLW
jgi:hypothetical protein